MFSHFLPEIIVTQYNITWTQAVSPTNKSVLYRTRIIYPNSTVIEEYNTTSLFYYWNNTNYDIGRYTVSTFAFENNTNDQSDNTDSLIIHPITNFFTVNAYNYLGTTLLTNINTSDYERSISQTSNPYQYDIFSYLNLTAYHSYIEATVLIQDLTFQHRNTTASFNITRYINEFNTSLNPNQLMFTFYQNEALFQTEGVIHDTNRTFAFDNTSVVLIQQDLATGYIKAKFGMQSGVNWTQYYEYINDFEMHVDEDIEILQNADTTMYLQILDLSGARIKDVTIRAEYANSEIGNYTQYLLLGQRLTDDDGKTFFWGDSASEILFTISKTGYTPVEQLITIGDESYTLSNPKKIYLTKSSTTVLNQAWLYIKANFINNSIDKTGTIIAKGRDRVQFNTNYRQSFSLSAKDITAECDGFMRCPFTLTSGTDFNSSSTEDIIMYVYLDSELWNTYTFTYDTDTKTEVFTFDSLSANYLNPLLAIAIIFISLLIGVTFKSPNSGTTTFFITSILAGFISSAFLWLSSIIALYYTFIFIRKVISE